MIEKNYDCQKLIFARQTYLILNSFKSYGDRLLFMGYDKEFMEKEETINAMRDALEKRKFLNNVPCPVSAIVNENEDISGLESIAHDFGDEIEIIKTPKSMRAGFTVFGKKEMCFWDSTRDYRNICNSFYQTRFFSNIYEKLEKETLVLNNRV